VLICGFYPDAAFEPFMQWLGDEGQILSLETVDNEIPQMAWLSLFRLGWEPVGKIPQDDADGYEVGFLLRQTRETNQPLLPRLQGMCGQAKHQMCDEGRLAGTGITQEGHMALADDSLKHAQRASLPFCRWRVLCTPAFSLLGQGDLRRRVQVDIDLREIETLLTAGWVAGTDIQPSQ
jgi:hypothetical protein